MRTLLATLAALLIAPGASAQMMGDKLARDLCGYNSAYYTLTPIEYSAYMAVDVVGKHVFDAYAEFYFTRRIADGIDSATCKRLSRFNNPPTCTTAPVSRSNSVLNRTNVWTDTAC